MPEPTDPTGPDEVNTPSMFAVAAETDPVEEELQKLDPSLRTASVRAALQDQRRRLGVLAAAQEALREARTALQAAVDRGSIPDAVQAASRASAADVVLGMVPSPDLDWSGCQDVFRLAVQMVNSSLEGLPLVEPLAYSLEVQAWKSLPPLSLQLVPPPIRTPEVGDLEAEIDAWTVQLAGVTTEMRQRGVQLETPDSGGLGFLSRVAPLVEGITDTAATGRELAARVADANRQRRESGLEWSLAKTPTFALDQMTSPEIRVLQKFRQAQMVAVP
jgi:hypothetical protein